RGSCNTAGGGRPRRAGSRRERRTGGGTDVAVPVFGPNPNGVGRSVGKTGQTHRRGVAPARPTAPIDLIAIAGDPTGIRRSRPGDRRGTAGDIAEGRDPGGAREGRERSGRAEAYIPGPIFRLHIDRV